ncbi:C2H2 type master regulator of conidiophore development brlA [Colletotrichum spaethianum]|uniref:C2H2 type master regulator of conidiophore development brlA n=1 Tax=Colletotrichum spaethianum TaxID=700344 RepID=A0AA37LEI1_9PEZI|nr:C2H2 type master regulator of conidiophore development brlA [Colletotrichum spaethianum]GKT44515.1 C2H2 type master regulator of conidiophore development brlA [Colletotrichum spaethianum]
MMSHQHLWQQEQDHSIESIMDSFAPETSFNFDGSVSCGTTTPSFSAASSVYDPNGPFTPRSGRSTPHDHHSNIDFDSSFSSQSSFSFDHGASQDHKGYFHKPEKVEIQMPMQFSSNDSLTPSRRQSSGYGMEHLDYNTMLHVTLNSHCMPGMSSPHHHQHQQQQQQHHHHHHHHAEQYSLPQDLSSSPFVMPTPHRALHSSTPSNGNIWPCSSESPIMMFGNESTPSTSPLHSITTNVKRETTHSPSPLHSSPSAAAYRQDPRRKLFAEVQRKTLALQKNQNDMEALRQLRSIQVNQDGSVLDCGSVKVRHVAPRRERCTYPDCTKTFKRKEHLKRHFKATHEKEVELYTCPATNCNHVFKERRDNFVSHLLLHKQGKSSRTPYNEKAAKLYDEMCLQSKSRKRVKTSTSSSPSSSTSNKN